MNDVSERIRRGWRLTRIAWGMLLHDPTALLLAGVQTVAAVGLVVAMFTASGWVDHPGQESRLALAAVIAYLPSTLISTFIGVALCAAVAATMDGEHLTTVRAAPAVSIAGSGRSWCGRRLPPVSACCWSRSPLGCHSGRSS